MIEWLQSWFESQCDEDWEHEYGVRIETLDNPGWCIRIDLAYTDWEGIDLSGSLVERSEHDWYLVRIENNEFYGVSDPSKLGFLIEQFKHFVEKPLPTTRA